MLERKVKHGVIYEISTRIEELPMSDSTLAISVLLYIRIRTDYK